MGRAPLDRNCVRWHCYLPLGRMPAVACERYAYVPRVQFCLLLSALFPVNFGASSTYTTLTIRPECGYPLDEAANGE